MPASMPLLLVPGLTCTARLYTPQVEALWPFAPVTIPDHRQDDHIDAIARRILADAPPRFPTSCISTGVSRSRTDANASSAGLASAS